MVDLDRAGIARSAAALGSEGTNLLLLKTSGRYDAVALDAVLPADDNGHSPANGGWFRGPKGWLLLVEGLDDQVDPWIEDLAAGLRRSGVAGTLTGAGSVPQPMWARRLEDPQRLNALIGFRPQLGFDLWHGWAPGEETVGAAVDVGLSWLTAHDGKLMAFLVPGGHFWVQAAAAAQLMAGDTRRIGQYLASSYAQDRREVRTVSLSHAAGITLSSEAEGLPWRETVAELRAALVAAPLAHVSVAQVSHRDWRTLLGVDVEGSEHYGRLGYKYHPERWDEFVLEPSGIQILTDRHLAAASDLSSWQTTRLDDDHVLVEARDLTPWFATPRRAFDPLPPELVDQARRDFGGMILTPRRADELGLSAKPAPSV